jgi:hypothetical protein
MLPYNRAPGSQLSSLLVTVFGLLVVGVPFYLIVIRQGWAGLAAMPYAIPIAAVALALIIAIGHRLTGTGRSVGYTPVRGGNPAGGIVAGLALVAAGIAMSFKAGADVHRYDADPSCSALFTAGGTVGACRLERVKITQTFSCGRRGNSSCMTLQRSDGSTVSVTNGTNFRGSVFRGARNGDRSAEVQYFDGRVVQVETQSGRVATSDLPFEREKFWTLMGLVGGMFGLVATVAVLVRGVF